MSNSDNAISTHRYSDKELSAMPVPKLFSVADAYHADAVAYATTAVERGVESGRALLAAKKRTPYGEFAKLRDSLCSVGERQAQRYMQLARNAHLLEDASTINEAMAMLCPTPRRKTEPKSDMHVGFADTPSIEWERILRDESYVPDLDPTCCHRIYGYGPNGRFGEIVATPSTFPASGGTHYSWVGCFAHAGENDMLPEGDEAYHFEPLHRPMSLNFGVALFMRQFKLEVVSHQYAECEPWSTNPFLISNWFWQLSPTCSQCDESMIGWPVKPGVCEWACRHCSTSFRQPVHDIETPSGEPSNCEPVLG